MSIRPSRLPHGGRATDCRAPAMLSGRGSLQRPMA